VAIADRRRGVSKCTVSWSSTATGHLVEGVAAVGDVSPLSPGADFKFAVAGSTA